MLLQALCQFQTCFRKRPVSPRFLSRSSFGRIPNLPITWRTHLRIALVFPTWFVIRHHFYVYRKITLFSRRTTEVKTFQKYKNFTNRVIQVTIIIALIIYTQWFYALVYSFFLFSCIFIVYRLLLLKYIVIWLYCLGIHIIVINYQRVNLSSAKFAYVMIVSLYIVLEVIITHLTKNGQYNRRCVHITYVYIV